MTKALARTAKTKSKLPCAGIGKNGFVEQIGERKKGNCIERNVRATLFTIAKDVKIQIEFNPSKVQAYRLIGYENRVLENQDFNDDKKDAGELGAGDTVTALYEIIPVGVESGIIEPVDELKYQKNVATNNASPDELMTIKLHYKKPKSEKSQLITTVLKDDLVKLEKSSNDFRFSVAVAEFGMLLRDSEFKGDASYSEVLELAVVAKGSDTEG